MAKKLKKKVRKLTLLDLLRQKVDPIALMEKVYIDDDKLFDAAFEQPNLMLLSGRFRVQRMHIRVKLETQLDLERAKVGLRFRRIRDAGGKKEFTEGAVKERIELDPRVRAIRRRVDRAVALEELSKNLVDVFRTRSDSLRIIVQAGKISLHARELEILRGNKKMVKTIVGLRDSYRANNSLE